MLRRMIAILLCLIIMLSMSACGVKQKLNEKIAEKITEGVLEKVAGDGTDIDIKNGEMTIKGDDGQEISFGTSEWPEGGAADLIPEFKKGNIVSVINSDQACMVILEEVEKNDAVKYIENLKDEGFTNDASESLFDDIIIYYGYLDEKTMAGATYNIEGKEFSINVQISE